MANFKSRLHRRTAAAAALLALLCTSAQARIDPPAGMATDASNAVLPAAAKNLTYARGMACDGATDDTAAFQAAINSAYNAILQLPSGYCVLTLGQLVITNGVEIAGQGRGGEIGGTGQGTWLEFASGSGDAFSVQAKEAVHFHDFAMDVDNPQTSGACFALNGASGGGVNNYNFGSSFERINIGNLSGTSSCYDVFRMDEAGGFTIKNVFATATIHDTLLVVNSLNPDLGEHTVSGNYFWDGKQTSGTEQNNPFATTNGSPTVTVTHTNHHLVTGRTVVYQPVATFNNVTISGPYRVTVVDANTFTITAGTNANATSSGGGAAVKYAYRQNAMIEYQSSLGAAVIGNDLNGGAYGVLVNLKYGPTGTLRMTGNSLENYGYQGIAITQGTSGAEGGNFNITANEFSAQAASAIADLFVGTGTPTTQAKWIERLAFVGNATNDNMVNSGTSAVKVSDGNIINLSSNAMKNGQAGPTGIAVLSGATHVVEVGNTINFASGSYGTMNAGSFDNFVVNGTAVTVP